MIETRRRTRTSFLPFTMPCIGEEEIAEVVEALHSGWITGGPKAQQFEQDFRDTVGASAALALSSCTAALEIALATLGTKQGDIVVSTAMTFCSTIHVIEHLGARPVLVDVEPDTLNISPTEIARAVETTRKSPQNRVRAILPVHLYGHPCDLDAIFELARSFGLAVVHDAAHALAAAYRGMPIGSASLDSLLSSSQNIPTLTAFSFYATKNITTAEGGMLAGAQELIDDARSLSLHGMSKDAFHRHSEQSSWFYEVTRAGFKANMSDVQAAMGIAQLRRLQEFQTRRRDIAERYNAAFKDMEEIDIPLTRDGIEHAWHIYAIRLNLDTLRIDRSRFIEELRDRNIGASVHFIPVHLHPYYRDRYGFAPDDFPVAYREYRRLVSLPLFPAMGDPDVADVIEAVRDVVRRWRR